MERIIKRPLLSEKTSIATEKQNVYGFEVNPEANKHQIKKAVEALFDVKVLGVTTARLPGKLVRVRRGVKKSSGLKKAYVKVAEGQKIELFKGV